MLEYFPSNPGWTQSVACALSVGGELTEIHEACKSLVPLADEPIAIANEAWFQSWLSLSGRLEVQGDEMLARGWELSAGARYYRAAQYGFIAERHGNWNDHRKLSAYKRASALFAKSLRLLGHRTERVEVPFDGQTLAGYLRLPEGEGPFPTVIEFNGFDSIKEMTYGLAGEEAVRRGIAVLFMDQEGTGESVRYHGTAKPVAAEKAASAFIDRLEGHPLVDDDRIGAVGCSMGAYDAARAAAFEPRLKLVVTYAACYNLEPMRPSVNEMVAHPDGIRRSTGMDWEDQMKAVTGKGELGAAFDALSKRTLEGVLDRLTVPYLIVQGENDRLVPMWMAERSIAEAVNSPRAEAKIFSVAEGSCEHCGLDLMQSTSQYMFDWIAEIFGGTLKAA